jgi:hypothetical protein
MDRTASSKGVVQRAITLSRGSYATPVPTDQCQTTCHHSPTSTSHMPPTATFCQANFRVASKKASPLRKSNEITCVCRNTERTEDNTAWLETPTLRHEKKKYIECQQYSVTHDTAPRFVSQCSSPPTLNATHCPLPHPALHNNTAFCIYSSVTLVR